MPAIYGPLAGSTVMKVFALELTQRGLGCFEVSHKDFSNARIVLHSQLEGRQRTVVRRAHRFLKTVQLTPPREERGFSRDDCAFELPELGVGEGQRITSFIHGLLKSFELELEGLSFHDGQFRLLLAICGFGLEP